MRHQHSVRVSCFPVGAALSLIRALVHTMATSALSVVQNVREITESAPTGQTETLSVAFLRTKAF